jgi:hypothetical protein
MIRALLLIPLSMALAACSDGGEGGPATTTPTIPVTATVPAITTQTPVAATPTQTPVAATPTPQAGSQRAEQAAQRELARWLGPVADPAAISVASVEPVTWRNGCLELDRAGQACTLALVEGFRFELALGGARYEVRTDATGMVVLWAPDVQILVRFQEAGPNILRFSTDDGGAIVAQAVPGTDFGVRADSLAPGDPVGIALVQAPQSGGFLLVWMVSAS